MRWFFGLIVIVALAGVGYFVFKNSSGPLNISQLQLSGTASSTNVAQDTAVYSDPNFKFALSYPKDLEVHVYDEDDGSRTVTFEGASPGEGFQVYVTPYAETAITDAQFKKDDPSGVMQDSQDVSIGGVPAKVFTGHNDEMGDTREVWFIHNGYLYEVTTYKALDSWLTNIMESWKFL
jgi:hypothetical protein